LRDPFKVTVVWFPKRNASLLINNGLNIDNNEIKNQALFARLNDFFSIRRMCLRNAGELLPRLWVAHDRRLLRDKKFCGGGWISLDWKYPWPDNAHDSEKSMKKLLAFALLGIVSLALVSTPAQAASSHSKNGMTLVKHKKKHHKHHKHKTT
jgi:hypothetical protein